MYRVWGANPKGYDMTTMSITEARNKLTSLHSEKIRETITVTKRGKPVLALMDYEMYESLVETLAILADPELSKALRKSIKEAKEGKLIPLEEVEKQLA